MHRASRLPVIGLTGGIGSGKSLVASMFGDERCEVSDSDQLARTALADPIVASAIRARWGEQALSASEESNRRWIAEIVFGSEPDRRFLEALIHPWIARQREVAFAAAPAGTRALVIDAPLLLEAGLGPSCDRVIYVDCPLEIRQARVAASRGWTPAELARREAAQWPLDRKRALADHVIRNDGDPASLRAQVRAVLDEVSPV